MLKLKHSLSGKFMVLSKNTFFKKRENNQLTPDLSPLDKSDSARPEMAPEKSFEASQPERQPSYTPLSREKIDQPAASQPVSVQSSAPQPQLAEIEDILQENMADVYFNMSQAQRQLFKEEGERTAKEIGSLIASGKSVAVKVLELIKKWLRFIPGINKFFLEQEAKIKTDKILNIANPYHK